jgi:hypothetical protein
LIGLGLAFVLQYHGLMDQPFHVHIDDTVLDDLKKRIVDTQWPDEIRNAGWQHGVALAYMKDLTAYWATTFD